MYLDIADLTMYFSQKGTGKTIVLLHGLGLDHSIWDRVTELFQEEASFITPDLRGHGKTTLGHADQTVEQMAEDVNLLIDSLGLHKVVLGGHSMGGYVALAFAEKFPQKLAGLALIATNATPDSPEKRTQRLQDAKSLLVSGSRYLADSLSPRLTTNPEIETAMYKLIEQTTPEGLVNAELAIASRPDRTQVVTSLECPILVVAGLEDKITPRSVSNFLVELNSKADLVEIEDAGHMPMLESPDKLGSHLIELGKKSYD